MLSNMKQHQLQKRKLQLGKRTIIKLTNSSARLRQGGGGDSEDCASKDNRACVPVELSEPPTCGTCTCGSVDGHTCNTGRRRNPF